MNEDNREIKDIDDVKKEEKKRKYNYDYIKKRKSKSKENIGIMKNFSMVTQIGLIFLTSVFLFLLIGYLLDRCIGTELLFKIIFMILGVISGFFNVYKTIMKNIE